MGKLCVTLGYFWLHRWFYERMIMYIQINEKYCSIIMNLFTVFLTTGTSLQQNARRGQSQNKPPSKSPSKQLSVAVSFSTKDRHKPAPKFYIGGKNGVALYVCFSIDITRMKKTMQVSLYSSLITKPTTL